MEKEMVCTFCGREIQAEYRYCPFCGTQCRDSKAVFQEVTNGPFQRLENVAREGAVRRLERMELRLGKIEAELDSFLSLKTVC